jgi:hypothetical protein
VGTALGDAVGTCEGVSEGAIEGESVDGATVGVFVKHTLHSSVIDVA